MRRFRSSVSRFVGVLVIETAIAVIAACGPAVEPAAPTASSPTNSPPPAPSDTPAPPPISGPKVGELVLFSDTFDSRKDGWALNHAVVKDGHLVFSLDTQGLWASYMPTGRKNVHLAFDVTLDEGDSETAMAAICRSNDSGSYYMFVIWPDGYYAIVKWLGNTKSWLVEPTFSEAIQPGKTTNQIEVICAGPWLQLMINGSPMATIHEDQPLSGGFSALVAGRDAPGAAIVSFDNLVVSVPDETSFASPSQPTRTSGGLVALPTALGGKTNTIFPVPGAQLRNFVDYGDGAIDFETSLDMQATVSYYRDVLARNGLPEITDKASVADAHFRLVYDDLVGGFWVIEGTLLPDGWTRVKVREQSTN